MRLFVALVGLLLIFHDISRDNCITFPSMGRDYLKEVVDVLSLIHNDMKIRRKRTQSRL